MEEQKKNTLKYLPGDILRNLDPTAKLSKYWFIRIVSVEPENGVLGAALKYKFTAWNEEEKEMYYPDPDSGYNDFMTTSSDVLKGTYELYRRSLGALEYQARVWCNEICTRCHGLKEINSNDKCMFSDITWHSMRLPGNFMFVPGQEIAFVRNGAIVRTTRVKDIITTKSYEGLAPGFLARLENGRIPDASDIRFSGWPDTYDSPVKNDMYDVDLEVPLVMKCKFRDYCVLSDCKNCKCQTLKGIEDVDPKWKPNPTFFSAKQEGAIKKTTQEDYDVPPVEEKAPKKKESIIRRIIRWIKR
jgi:hypothetical protein